MARGFRPVDRTQPFLLPPDLREWLPKDHLAWLIIETVQELDLTVFHRGYRLGGVGRRAYDPAMMVTLLLYAYATGQRSSRQIERGCHTDLALRVIAANDQPDHATIARFRVHHHDALEDLFVQVLGLCVDAGLIDARVIAVDSTKMAGNASNRANLTREQLEKRAREVFDEAAATDAAEDAYYGQDRGDQPAPGWEPGPGRGQRIRQALDELDRHPDAREDIEARQRERERNGQRRRGAKPKPADPKKPWRVASKTDKKQRRANTTDPDSRTMRTPKGWQQGYSAQAVTDGSQIVLATTVTNDQNDNSALSPMISATRDNLTRAGHDQRVRVALADRGYWNRDEISNIEDHHNLTTLVAVVRDSDQRQGRSRADTASHTTMHHRLNRPGAKHLYRRRSAYIEPVFGQIKNRNITKFLLRGLTNVNTEWNLICTAHNLTKIHRTRSG